MSERAYDNNPNDLDVEYIANHILHSEGYYEQYSTAERVAMLLRINGVMPEVVETDNWDPPVLMYIDAFRRRIIS